MFSIHNTQNIKVSNFRLSNNFVYDDMMHIIYSDNVKISDCILDGSLFDALDIDLSTVEVANCKFTNSGNDSLDLMGSSVLLRNSKLTNSADKGVSVGEGTRALIYNTIINDNGIGVESKDGSDAYVVNSDLKNNKTQINAYKKNWRYGKGGNIHVEKSVLNSRSNKISTDKFSQIDVRDTQFIGSAGQPKKRVIISSNSDFGEKKSSREMNFSKIVEKQLVIWGVTPMREIRGAQLENW